MIPLWWAFVVLPVTWMASFALGFAVALYTIWKLVMVEGSEREISG
jgi:hypothetical protein